jgi:hypothetical protein
MIFMGLEQISFALKYVSTYQVLVFIVVGGVEFLLPETERLGHHTADIRHGLVIDLNAHRLDEICVARRVFGGHEFSLLKKVHFLVYFFNQKFKLVLVAFFLLVELHYPFLQCHE